MISFVQLYVQQRAAPDSMSLPSRLELGVLLARQPEPYVLGSLLHELLVRPDLPTRYWVESKIWRVIFWAGTFDIDKGVAAAVEDMSEFDLSEGQADLTFSILFERYEHRKNVAALKAIAERQSLVDRSSYLFKIALRDDLGLSDLDRKALARDARALVEDAHKVHKAGAWLNYALVEMKVGNPDIARVYGTQARSILRLATSGREDA